MREFPHEFIVRTQIGGGQAGQPPSSSPASFYTRPTGGTRPVVGDPEVAAWESQRSTRSTDSGNSDDNDGDEKGGTV